MQINATEKHINNKRKTDLWHLLEQKALTSIQWVIDEFGSKNMMKKSVDLSDETL